MLKLASALSLLTLLMSIYILKGCGCVRFVNGFYRAMQVLQMKNERDWDLRI